MNTRIDLAKCDGYANCVVEADEVFDIDEATGQAVVLLPTIPAERVLTSSMRSSRSRRNR